MEVHRGNFEKPKQLVDNAVELPKSPEQLIDVVVLASSSPRRKTFIKYLFPDKQVEIIPAGEELETSDVALIALDKADQVYSLIPTRSSTGNKDSTILILAADIRTSVPAIKSNEFHSVSSGKPIGPRGFEISLLQVCLLPDLADQPPHYRIDSGSARLIFPKERMERFPGALFRREQTVVTLRDELAAYLITPDGQEHYLQEFHDFYSSPPYANYDMPEIDTTSISAGISLPVLSRLDAIESINNINQSDPSYKDVLKKAIFLAAVGFSPRLLKFLVSDIDDRIENWAWLAEVTNKALNENPDKIYP